MFKWRVQTRLIRPIKSNGNAEVPRSTLLYDIFANVDDYIKNGGLLPWIELIAGLKIQI